MLVWGGDPWLDAPGSSDSWPFLDGAAFTPGT
jgi:hypothetical protein